MTKHGPGVMALACGEIARYSHSRTSIEGILRPAGTRRFTATSLSVAENFNDAAAALLANRELEWLFLMNDDHFYPPNTLLHLLDHLDAWGLDVLTGLYLERAAPFGPQIFNPPAPGEFAATRRYLQPTDPDVVEVGACGDGCLLVRRRVLERLQAIADGDPIWELGYSGYGSPPSTRAQSNHDMAFSHKVRRAGFKIFADLTVHVGHITPMIVWPGFRREQSDVDRRRWLVEFQTRPDRGMAFGMDAPTGDELATEDNPQ